MTAYPHTRRDDLVETLHGHRVADPYRWLEDPDSDETRDWVERQRAFTEQRLAALPERDWFRRRLHELVSTPRVMAPVHEAGWWFVARTDGVAPQPVWYAARTLDELAGGGGRVVLDPNQWSDDGSASLNGMSVSPDGRLLAYCRSEGGSDWQRVHVVELETGVEVADEPVVTKFSDPTWLPDGRSFLYSRYAQVGSATGTQVDALPPADLAVHRLGRAQADDEVLWANPGEAMLFTGAMVSADQRWLVVVQSWGTEENTALWAHPLSVTGSGDEARTVVGERVEVVPERTDAVWPVRVDGDHLVARTNRDAPLGRVVRLRLGVPGEQVELVPETGDTIEAVTAAGDGFVVTRLADCTPRYTRHALDGTLLGEVVVDGAADVRVSGEAGVDEVVVSTSSVGEPIITTAVWFDSGRSRRIELGTGGGAPGVAADTVRRRATSADGTQVPYWLIVPAGADPDEARPTIVYGYGGFNVTILPWYGHGWAAWLAAGGAVAIANLRGGAEFGQAWYDGGRRANKQHVFDDVIAVGEHLLATGAAAPGQLVVHGASNGGLLVGAAMTQRPHLFTVALPSVGVLDMLRFHRFTGGLAWASDYGNPDDPDDFAVALAYSPLHNVREGVAYPATLVCTGDHDDRVVPLHSHKFTAALQHAQAGDAPVLTRIETATGHGAGKPLAKVADEWADKLAFAAHHTGLAVPTA